MNISVCLLLTSCAQRSLADKNAVDTRVIRNEKEKANSDQNNNIRNTKVRVNPHWDEDKCNVCHIGAPSKDNTNLLNRDKRLLCIECHKDDLTHKYIHPVGIKSSLLLSKKIQDKWKSGMRLDSDNKMTCLTCHDLLNQCLPGRSYMKNIDQNFLREGSYSKRTEICYKCHDSSKYKKYNPHEQISKDGTIKLNKCRLCHRVSSKQQQINKGIKRDVNKYPIITKLNHDRTLLCIRCHKKIDHPTNALKVVSMNTYRHFIPITDDKKNTLDSMQKETSMILPLEPGTNRIYCATCHEPHEIGVFAEDGSKFTKVHKNRLRATDICKYCHDK